METVDIILEVLLLLGLLYLALFKSYFKEKGKNLATREDIQEITSLVETLRAKIEYSLQAKLVLRREEHESLLHYYSCLSKWIHTISSFSFAGITYDTLHMINERISSVNICYSETILAFSKVELLVNNDKLRAEGHGLIRRVLKYQNRTIKMCGDYHLLCLEIHAEEKRLKDGERVEEWAKVIAKQQIAIKKYYEEQASEYGTLLRYIIPHMETISAHLEEIVKEE